MNSELAKVRRVYAEKKIEHAIEARNLLSNLWDTLNMTELTSIRILNRYDLTGLTDAEYERAKIEVFAEPPLDRVYDESISAGDYDYLLAVEALPGQFDQRADSAEQCLQVLTRGDRPQVRSAKVYIFSGELNDSRKEQIKRYLINPVEAREAAGEIPSTLHKKPAEPAPIPAIHGFISMDAIELDRLRDKLGLAMSEADLELTRNWFAEKEHRDPTLTEIRVLDTYWSDHCRHTTFLTHLENVDFEEGRAPDADSMSERLADSYGRYLKLRETVYGERVEQKPICLMDIGTIAMKELKRQGRLQDLDESEEINACSIKVPIVVDGRDEEYLVMFKNETHNHPTEIEPFGGASTCLGGAIRDPLSGRSYVYQAMRITGAGDPTEPHHKTLLGKLPQRQISTVAAAGYSSYGNQIGVSAGLVKEFFHPGYVAKRMECGAVVAAAPANQVVRERPRAGDAVILVGGPTGRDGCGGATGSSKAHDESSAETSGAEVQKGNPSIERNLQRLFRDPIVARMIKRCNDFGAGGVSVAIGELADGLDINLDLVPVKYEGLDGTELAISESQERMAVVVRPDQVDAFVAAADKENLEAVPVAVVTDTNRMVMRWRGDVIVDLSRTFIETNGATQRAKATVETPDLSETYFSTRFTGDKGFAARVKEALGSLNVCSQKGLAERFDSTVGAGTILMPYGGRRQLTPEEGMAAKIPVLRGQTDAATLMTYGFDPELSSWSPYHGAYYAVLQSISRGTAMGGSPQRLRLTFQEYFPRTDSARSWGAPVAALLGALDAQMDFGVPSIGGKDSMSGTFEDLHVPPTLISFAVGTRKSGDIHSATLSATDSELYYIPIAKDDQFMPIPDKVMTVLRVVHSLQKEDRVRVTATVDGAGPAIRVIQMCLGNELGFNFNSDLSEDLLFMPDPGALLVEVPRKRVGGSTITRLLEIGAVLIGQPSSAPLFTYDNSALPLEEALRIWEAPLSKLFPLTANSVVEQGGDGLSDLLADQVVRTVPTLTNPTEKKPMRVPNPIDGKPNVFIPIFPGTNSEYDLIQSFETAGAKVDSLVVRNRTGAAITDSVEKIAERLARAQILTLPGGSCLGDEPEGAAKFISALFRDPTLVEAVRDLLFKRDGLILGIGNGFQALLQLGLLGDGDVTRPSPNSMSLTFNTIGRHISSYANTRVVSNRSPWLAGTRAGDVHNIPISHVEGRFVADAKTLETLREKDQIATQYVDLNEMATMKMPGNPNGSIWAIEGITSPDGRIFGKMGHSERYGADVAANISGNKDQKLFVSGVDYFAL